MLKVVVVDDSALLRQLIVHILESDPNIKVVGTAEDGADAADLVAKLKPDVVTMDIQMRNMDGYEATRRIMQTTPVPIVIVTASYSSSDINKTFKALEVGAVAVVNKPPGPASPNHKEKAEKLIKTVKLMSEVHVVRRSRTKTLSPPVFKIPVKPKHSAIQVVAIGASTGGPPVLQELLAPLPDNFPLPILIVQHISPGFIQGLADWLQGSTSLEVRIAKQNEHLEGGRCYLAPDDFHMEIAADNRVILSSAPPEEGTRPSITRLFRSVASVYGGKSLGVLLTGMGRDGAAGLKEMKTRGAITIVQDEDSSIIFGMPREAIAMHAADHVLSPTKIASVLKDVSDLSGPMWGGRDPAKVGRKP